MSTYTVNSETLEDIINKHAFYLYEWHERGANVDETNECWDIFRQFIINNSIRMPLKRVTCLGDIFEATNYNYGIHFYINGKG